jgi:hypothetical protein
LEVVRLSRDWDRKDDRWSFLLKEWWCGMENERHVRVDWFVREKMWKEKKY